VGSHLARGISGGQKKRVTTGAPESNLRAHSAFATLMVDVAKALMVLKGLMFLKALMFLKGLKRSSTSAACSLSVQAPPLAAAHCVCENASQSCHLLPATFM